MMVRVTSCVVKGEIEKHPCFIYDYSKSDTSLMGESTWILLKRFAIATSSADAMPLRLGICLAGVPPGDLGRGVFFRRLALPDISLRKFGFTRVGVAKGAFLAATLWAV